jgi:nucleoside-diphosphate-sugar epimerase
MSSNQELHVIFGTGPLGKNAARELVRLGKRVRMVNRSGRATDLPASVEVVRGDAYSAASVKEATKGATAVYQCAQPEYHEWAAKFPPLQAAILEGAAANGAKLIVGDNLYLYGDPNGKPITEASPVNPVSKKGEVRAAMAQAVLDAHKAGKIRAAIGRASNFVGPEYDILGGLVFYPLLEGGTLSLLGNLDVPHTFTYIPDFGRGLATLGTRDEALGQAWIVPSLPAQTQRTLMTQLAAEAGKPLKMRAAGRMILRLLGLFNPAMRETVEMMYEWEKPFIVDSRKFEQTFGIAPTPLEVVIRETIAWYRQHPRSSAKTA